MDKKDLWKSILVRLSAMIGHSPFITFFKNSAIMDIDRELLVIGVPFPMHMNYINEHFREELLKTCQELIPEIKTINIQVDLGLQYENDPRHLPSAVFTDTNPNKGRKKPREAQVILKNGWTTKILDRSYTLENFVVSGENRLAHAACMAVSSAPGSNYNPLFLYGNTGVGKTHLLQAVGNEILKRNAESVVIYTTSEEFTNDYIHAVQNRKMSPFNNLYRKVDVLIVDDIQFLSGKSKSEESFFHTFNAIYDAGKQIIIASDRPPHELSGLDKRLTSRLQMGMVCDVQPPEFETRLAILHEKVKKHHIIIDPKVLEFIAMNVTESVRELEGVLLQVVAEADLETSTPTMRSVEAMLIRLRKDRPIIGGSGVALTRSKVVSSEDDVIKIVSNYFQVQSEQVKGPSRKQEIAMTRQVAMYIMKREMNFSLQHIGKVFGGRNHTTAMHSINNIKSRLINDIGLQRDINALRKEIGVA